MPHLRMCCSCTLLALRPEGLEGVPYDLVFGRYGSRWCSCTLLALRPEGLEGVLYDLVFGRYGSRWCRFRGWRFRCRLVSWFGGLESLITLWLLLLLLALITWSGSRLKSWRRCWLEATPPWYLCWGWLRGCCSKYRVGDWLSCSRRS